MNLKITRKEAQTMRAAGHMKNWLHHNLNSLHIYCRLVKIMPRRVAREIVLHWEKTTIYGLMYART